MLSRILSCVLLSAALVQASQQSLIFEPNLGQRAGKSAFLARSPGLDAELAPTGALIRNGDSAPVRLRFHGAASSLEPKPEQSLSSHSTHIGARTIRAPHYRRVRFPSIYPGIDAIWYGNGSSLEYDLEIAPGADPSRIRLAIEGTRSMRIDDGGNLVVNASGREMIQQRPHAYQQRDGQRVEIGCRYALRGATVRFEVDAYDRSRPLIIDPVLVPFGHYFKKSAVDARGNVYVVQPAEGIGSSEAVTVYKYLRNGTPVFAVTFPSLVYSLQHWGSYISIAVGLDESIYVGGSTNGSHTTRAALQPNPGGGIDGFVAKIDARGSGLVWSTYLGGTGADGVADLAVDAAGNVHVVGSTSSPDFPTRNALQTSLRGTTDMFLAKIDSNGTALAYSTYLGGPGGFSYLHSIALDSTGNLYAGGTTTSSSFPVSNAFQPVKGASSDGVLLRLAPHATGTPSVVWATYYGSALNESADRVVVDRTGFLYFMINNAGPLPELNPITRFRGGGDVYVAKMNPNGSQLIYATYLGGTGGELGRGLAVDSTSSLWVSCYTTSADYPIVDPPRDSMRFGPTGGGLSKIAPAGNVLLTSFFTASGPEPFGDIALDPDGSPYVAGTKLDRDESTPYFVGPIPDGISFGGVGIQWVRVPGTVVYEIQLTSGADVVYFAGVDAKAGVLTGENLFPNLDIQLPSGNYVARIRACQSRELVIGQGYKSCGEPVYRMFSVQDDQSTLGAAVTSPPDSSTLTGPGALFTVAFSNFARRSEFRVTRNGETVFHTGALRNTTSESFYYTFEAAGLHEAQARICGVTPSCGPWSTPVRFTVSSPPAPIGAPLPVTVTTAPGSVNVSWTAVPNAELYTVQVVQPSGGPAHGPFTVASRRVAGTSATILAPAGAAGVTVKACNPNGCSVFSPGVLVTIPGPDPASPILGYQIDSSVNPDPFAAFSWSRIPGDDGTNTTYRLYVQDLARQTVALDVYSTGTFYVTRLAGSGTVYSAQAVAIRNGVSIPGAAIPFIQRTGGAQSPAITFPSYNGSIRSYLARIGWTSVPGAFLYEYFVTRPGIGSPAFHGVASGTSVPVPMEPIGGSPTVYDAIVRACTGGTGPSNCTWGPWSIFETGVGRFTVTP